MKRYNILMTVLCLLLFFSCQKQEELQEAEAINSFQFTVKGDLLEFPSFDVYDAYLKQINHDHPEIIEYLGNFPSLRTKIDKIAQDFYENNISSNDLKEYYSLKKNEEEETFLELHYPFYAHSLFLNEEGIVKIGTEYWRFGKEKVAYTKDGDLEALRASAIHELSANEALEVTEVTSSVFQETEEEVDFRGTLEYCVSSKGSYKIITRFIGNSYCIGGDSRVEIQVWVSKQNGWYAYHSGWGRLVDGGGYIKLLPVLLFDGWEGFDITQANPNGPYYGNYSFMLYNELTSANCSAEWGAYSSSMEGSGNFPVGVLSCDLVGAYGEF